jgi:biopolymer transport protein TolR
MSEINVVPYIDVMLVLLVIFMVTAPLVNPGQVDLPSVAKSSQPAVAPMEVSIRADESIWLRDRSQPGAQDERMDRARLLEAIRAKQQRHPDQAVVIAADKSVKYELVVNVMDKLQRAGIQRVGLSVQVTK